ncbi:tRNA (adenine(22)-N(1))-methyltransferase [Ureaplasma diversum]|uniref:SAM-dependent methyltransferase n=1 Tax=Ureaplasma diversum NCTC 246 TaxID=1188241 RepID=A0A084EWT0_9BACT|nr:class I SAM-dependent methyltransferase [Ureaplasma diversum]KEZ22422.1 Hypothetical protein, putative SAM-dependent methyltransferase [Ureaplasma diversum NCTC 246]
MQLKNKRLEIIANLIQPCEHVVDIGSDHAWLGVFLLFNNIAKFVTNIEINPQPLANGIKNLTRYNLLNRTNNILNDGLTNLDHLEFDYCSIAGMGASNIIQIMQQFNNHKLHQNWILQANSNVHLLRKYLYQNNFDIIKEQLLFENKHYYFIILAKKIDVNIVRIDEKGYYISSGLLASRDQLYHRYLIERLKYLQTLNEVKISNELKNELETIRECLLQWK